MTRSNVSTSTLTRVFKSGDYTLSDEEEGQIRIVMEGFGSGVDPGKPQLPGKTFHIELPKDAVFKKLDIIYRETSELEGTYKIIPARPIVHDCPDTRRETPIDEAMEEWMSNYRITYQSDDLFPHDSIVHSGHWIGRNKSYIRIRFHPFQYRPKSGQLILHKSVKIAISFTVRMEEEDTLSKRQDSHTGQSNTNDSTNQQGKYNFVIIVPDAIIAQAVTGFKTWKEFIGHSVAIVESRHIYNNYSGVDNAARIREFLIDKYEEWGIHYVMLVGDWTILPSRILYSRPLPGKTYRRPYVTDFYYADLQTVRWDVDGDQRWGEFDDDAFSWLYDVVVSRLPFNQPDEIEKICNNIISFEMDTGAWKNTELFAHGFLDLCPTDTAELAERIESDYLTPRGWNAIKLYEQGGTASTQHSSDGPLIQQRYEAECNPKKQGVVCLTAHGHPDFMQSLTCTEPSGNCDCTTKKYIGRNNFGNSNRITGDFLSAIVVMNGCSTAWPHAPNISIIDTSGRSLFQIGAVQEHNGKRYLKAGAVAVIGSSAGSDYASQWKHPVDGGSQSLIYYFHEHLIGHGKSVGDAFFDAAVDQANKHGLARGLRVFYLMGDPSLIVTGIKNLPLYQYAVKVVCGKTDGSVLAPGEYWTAINVHNPTASSIRFRKKIAVALPNEQAGPVTEFFDTGLGPQETLEIDREDIFIHTKHEDKLLKGFVILESYIELDVVAVYTAAGSTKHVDAIYLEHVSPRRQQYVPGRKPDLVPLPEGKPDLVPVPDNKGLFCKISKDAKLIVTVKNQGTRKAGSSMTKVDFSGHGIVTKPTRPLTPGDWVDLFFEMPTLEGRFIITVDADDDVIESNEGNNSASGFCIG